MVFKKYVRQGGKKYGPYYYDNTRVGGKVVSTYIGNTYFSVINYKAPHLASYLAFAFIFLILLTLFLIASHPTGNAVLNVYTTYNPGENLDGSLRLVLQPGELIPADSRVLLTLGNVS